MGDRARTIDVFAIAAALAGGTSGCALLLDWDFAVEPAADAGARDATRPPRDAEREGDAGRDGGSPDAGPTDPSGIVEISAGALHTCARRTDGAVFCWGDNAAAQLGSGSASDLEDRPILAMTTADIRQLALGAAFTCTWSNQVSCFGADDRGQAGDGTVDPVMPARSTMIGSEDVCALTAGGAFACMIRGVTCESLRCTGDNTHGQLGDGSTDSGSAVPTTVITGDTPVQIDGGAQHVCMVGAAGLASCWGNNDFGQLGDGTTTSSNLPVRVAKLTNLLRVVAGGAFSCALTPTGDLACWGAGESGQLANGVAGRGSAVPVSGGHRLLTTERSLDLGAAHGCGIAGATVVCWGDDSNEQLGQVSDIALGSPTMVVGMPDPPLQVATGDRHSCALTTRGDVWCWGDNSDGQLGVSAGDTPRSRAPIRVPVPAP